MKTEVKHQKRERRHKRIRARIIGTAKRPRFCVFRSLKHVYAQLIDDEKNKVLLSVSDSEVKKTKKSDSKLGAKQQHAFEVGKLAALKAKELKITSVVFDRGGFVFHGRIKAIAQGARDGGLKF